LFCSSIFEAVAFFGQSAAGQDLKEEKKIVVFQEPTAAAAKDQR